MTHFAARSFWGHYRALPPGARRLARKNHLWFADVVANAARELRVSDVYTLMTVRAYSSWTEITLEETGSTPYNDIWFERLFTMPSAA